MSERAHFPALDGLRFLCCATVIVAHVIFSFPAMRYADLGVRVFFALSGFLITTLLLRERALRGRAELRAFYVRRALRIFPPYFAALGAFFAAFAIFGEPFLNLYGVRSDTIDCAPLVLTHAFFVANWYKGVIPIALEVLWSVSVEEQFYLLFPITFARSARRRPVLFVALFALPIIWGVRLYCALHAPDFIHRNPIAIGEHFIFGALLAEALLKSERFAGWTRRLGTLGEAAALVGLVAVAKAGAELLPTHDPIVRFLDPLFSALFAAALVALLAVGAGWMSRILSLSVLRWLGTLTYGAYLFQMYPVTAAKALYDGTIARCVAALVFTFAVAALVRVIVERPFLRLKKRFE